MTPETRYAVVVSFPVHWGDMDALGHVNNARYFTWFESARIALLDRVGVQADGPCGIGPILASASCDFVRPVTFPSTVAVGARVASVGRTSLTIAYAVWPAGQPGDERARGTSVVVLVDYRTMQKVQVPDDVRARVGGLSAPTAGIDA